VTSLFNEDEDRIDQDDLPLDYDRLSEAALARASQSGELEEYEAQCALMEALDLISETRFTLKALTGESC